MGVLVLNTLRLWEGFKIEFGEGFKILAICGGLIARFDFQAVEMVGSG